MRNLLETIIRCNNIDVCISGKNKNHPCSSVVLSQGISEVEKLRVPEPWSGRIDTAPVLFIADSTKIATEEDYPTSDWPEYLIKDFFNNRFGDGRKSWVKDGLYPLCSDGTYKKQWNRLWSACANRTLELFETININPGYDFAVSETSRCRTFKQLNRKDAVMECSSRYLKQVIDLSGASIIVGMGDDVRRCICKVCGIETDELTYGPLQVGHEERCFAFLPHNNSRGPRTFGETIKRDELYALINYLKNNS